MSKAFTKETEEEADLPEISAPLPPGTKNYLTPGGHARLVEELRQLRRVERPRVVEVVSWAAGNGDRSENGDYLYGKKRLREIDRRVRYLMKRMEIAEVVHVELQRNRDQVFFGATVLYEDGKGHERTVRRGRGPPGSGRGQLGLPHRPGPAQGHGGRRGQAAHAFGGGGDRGDRDYLHILRNGNFGLVICLRPPRGAARPGMPGYRHGRPGGH